jgi:hypothetical protein
MLSEKRQLQQVLWVLRGGVTDTGWRYGVDGHTGQDA